jgi:ABC-2 type transport system ATP-binding protein
MIDVINVTKNFGAKTAVHGVSFNLSKGEVLGFLGPNGAGKSTTMRMITGYLTPTSGMVKIAGKDVQSNSLAARQRIGYLPESAPAYSDLSVSDFLHFAAEIRGIRGQEKAKAVDRVIEMCFLTSVRHQSIDTLSKGYRHRTCFAQSIIHDPEVLILDEPTDGLDPNQKHEVRSLIRHMGETKAIVFSTHILEEVEAVCTRAMIIDRGKVVANGTPADLKGRGRNAGALLVTFRASKNDVKGALKALPGIHEVESIDGPADEARFRLHSKNSRHDTSLEEALFALASKNSWGVLKLTRDEGRLDEVFRGLTLPDTAASK